MNHVFHLLFVFGQTLSFYFAKNLHNDSVVLNLFSFTVYNESVHTLQMCGILSETCATVATETKRSHKKKTADNEKRSFLLLWIRKKKKKTWMEVFIISFEMFNSLFQWLTCVVVIVFYMTQAP